MKTIKRISIAISALCVMLTILPAAVPASETQACTEKKYDNGVFEVFENLGELDAFEKNDFTVQNISDTMYADNYGNVYVNTFYHAGMGKGYVEYYLNGEYTELAGTIYINNRALGNGYDHTWDDATIRIYGDDELLYAKSGGFDPKFKPLDILLNIRGVSFLKIEMESNTYIDLGHDNPLIMFGGVKLTPQ